VGTALAAIQGYDHGHEVSGTALQDTLKTSLCAIRLFPTAECPARQYLTPLDPILPVIVAEAARTVGNEYL
jgi:hypothetical protein